MAIALPGDLIDTQARRLGPGLRSIPQHGIIATTAGTLRSEKQGTTVWLTGAAPRYVPTVGDSVIAQVTGRFAEGYRCDIGAAHPATLDMLAFPGANRKNRPQLHPGSLVYAKVTVSGRDTETEISCIVEDKSGGSATTPSAGGAGGYGVLSGQGTQAAHIASNLTKGGVGVAETGTLVSHVPRTTCARLLTSGGESILDRIASTVAKHGGFEACIGINGRVWLKTESHDARVALWIRDAILDTGHMSSQEQDQWVQAHAKQLP